MAADDKMFNHGLFLSFTGSVLFFSSFKKIKIFRQIRDTPTSKIRSAALGCNVEVQGKVCPANNEQVISPLSHTAGQVFIWKIQRLVKQGKSSTWKDEAFFYSSPFLYIYDESPNDIAAIDLASCSFLDDYFYEILTFKTHQDKLSEEVKAIFSEYNLDKFLAKGNLLFHKEYRILEHVFTSDEKIFALGKTFHKPDREKAVYVSKMHRHGDLKFKIKRLVRKNVEKLRLNKLIVKEFDWNNDLEISDYELKELENKVEQKILKKFHHEKLSLLSRSKFIFAYNDSKNIFDLKRVLISSRDERGVKSRQSWVASNYFYGGAVLMVIGAVLITLSYARYSSLKFIR